MAHCPNRTDLHWNVSGAPNKRTDNLTGWSVTDASIPADHKAALGSGAHETSGKLHWRGWRFGISEGCQTNNDDTLDLAQLQTLCCLEWLSQD